jgi:hypothetical protein
MAPLSQELEPPANPGRFNFDVTPVFEDADDVRGYEIQAWLDLHPGVTRYAILDDDCDMLLHQLPNHFRTVSELGITPEIAARVIAHLQA